MRYVIVVVILLSFISTFNQFGLIYLMTQGGPGGATRLYPILAYEKAIASLQYGPGSAIALSVAPLMALLIWLLARFMRRGERTVVKTGRVPQIGPRLGKFASRIVSFVLDVIFWPIDQISQLLGRVGKWLLSLIPMKADQRRGAARERQMRAGTSMRVLGLVPILLFVLFPFYWIVVTALKTTSQVSERRSIFWPDPFTFEQFRTLILDTPFLTWLMNSFIVATASTAISVSFAALAAYALLRGTRYDRTEDKPEDRT